MLGHKKIAIFDIDGTIFRSSLLLELLEALVQAGVISKDARSVYANSWKKWQAREGSPKTGFAYREFISDVIQAYCAHIRGVRRAEVWKIADRVVNFHKMRLYRYTRGLIRELSRSHFLLAISHSPYEVVAPFAKSLGFDKVYAMVYEVDSRVRFTGKVLYEDIILHKDKVLERALEKGDFTLKGSVGVGDTESDIPFLKMVERPIAFNPSKALYEEAKKRGWDIVVERKDMVYYLK